MMSRMPGSRKRAAGYAVLALVDTALAARSHRAGARPEQARTAQRARRLRFVTKPLLMPTLAASFRSATAVRDDRLRNATLAAQTLSWGGDVALLGNGRRAFLTGVGSFLAAHVAYIAGFSAAGERGPGARDTTGARAAAAAWVLLTPPMTVLAGRQDPTMRLPIAGYATVLSTMFASSTLLDHRLSRRARRKIVGGTSLFLLSDAVLGVQEFMRSTRSPMFEGAVMATYTAGQWLIAEGVADAGRN